MIGKRLPFATPAGAEMTAKRLQTIFRRGYHFAYESFIVVVIFPGKPDVHDVARNGERYEYDSSVPMSQSFAFSGASFDSDVLQQDVDFFPRHGQGSVKLHLS
jgi:hypothetical protein